MTKAQRMGGAGRPCPVVVSTPSISKNPPPRTFLRRNMGRKRTNFSSKGAVARGYSTEHKRQRAAWKRRVDAGEVNCWRCGQFIPPFSKWHLGHDDLDRSIYRGPEHVGCNCAVATHKAERNGTLPPGTLASCKRATPRRQPSQPWPTWLGPTSNQGTAETQRRQSQEW
jgi:hypothetical protein